MNEFVQSFGFDSEKTVLIKISPRIGGAAFEKELTEENFLTHFKTQVCKDAKVYQLALQGHLCHKDELTNTCSK